MCLCVCLSECVLTMNQKGVCISCCTCVCVLKPGETETFKTGKKVEFFWTEPCCNDVNSFFTYIITQSLIGYIDGCHGYQITCTIKNTIPQKSTPISLPSNYLQIPPVSVSIMFLCLQDILQEHEANHYSNKQ